MIEFGSFSPDSPETDETILVVANNVYKDIHGYVSYPGPTTTVITGSFGSETKIFGAEEFYIDSTNVRGYCGSTASLFQFYPSITDRSRTSTSPAYTTVGEKWRFTKYSDVILATNYVNNIQSITASASNFTDLSGSPPKSRYFAVVREFLVLAYIEDGSTRQNRLHWSGFDNITQWTPGTNQSDIQNLDPNFGYITGIHGGEYGIVFQTDAIYRMDYVGPPNIFQFNIVILGTGCFFPDSIVPRGRSLFFISSDGFYELIDGSQIRNIGRGKVDRYFMKDLKSISPSGIPYTNTHIKGVYDKKRDLIIWGYGNSFTAGVFPFSKGIIYNPANGEFSTIDLSTDTLFQNNEKNQSFGIMGIIATTNAYYTFNDATSTATLETGQFGGDRYNHISGARLYAEGNGYTEVSCQVGVVSDLDNVTFVSYSATSVANASGVCNLRSTGRYQRIRFFIKYGFFIAKGYLLNSKNKGKKTQLSPE